MPLGSTERKPLHETIASLNVRYINPRDSRGTSFFSSSSWPFCGPQGGLHAWQEFVKVAPSSCILVSEANYYMFSFLHPRKAFLKVSFPRLPLRPTLLLVRAEEKKMLLLHFSIFEPLCQNCPATDDDVVAAGICLITTFSSLTSTATSGMSPSKTLATNSFWSRRNREHLVEGKE